jgi:hypothetical protein
MLAALPEAQSRPGVVERSDLVVDPAGVHPLLADDQLSEFAAAALAGPEA